MTRKRKSKKHLQSYPVLLITLNKIKFNHFPFRCDLKIKHIPLVFYLLCMIPAVPTRPQSFAGDHKWRPMVTVEEFQTSTALMGDSY